MSRTQAPNAALRQLAGLAAATPWRFWLGFGVGRLASLVVLPVVSRTSGTSGLGRFEVALAVMVSATIVLDAGLGAAVVRYSGDERYATRDVVGAAGLLQMLASTGAALVCAVAMVLVGPAGVSIAALAAIAALFCFVEGLAVLAAGLLRAEGRDGLYLALSAGRFAMTGVVGAAGAIAWGVVGALLGIAVGGTPFAILWLRRWARARTVGSAVLRHRIARYGLPLIVTTVATWTLASSDRLFLQGAVSSQSLGQYSANYRLGTVVLIFVAGPLALAWLAEARRTDAAIRGARLRAWTAGFTLVSLCVGGLTVACASFLVPAVFGAEFEADALVVGLVALSGWFGGLWYFAATPIIIGDRTVPLAQVAALAVVLNLGLNVLLIDAYGSDGAALATLLSYAALPGMTLVAVHRLGGSADG